MSHKNFERSAVVLTDEHDSYSPFGHFWGTILNYKSPFRGIRGTFLGFFHCAISLAVCLFIQLFIFYASANVTTDGSMKCGDMEVFVLATFLANEDLMGIIQNWLRKWPKLEFLCSASEFLGTSKASYDDTRRD